MSKSECIVKDKTNHRQSILQVDDHQIEVTTRTGTILDVNDTQLDALSGGGNNNIGEGSTKLQIFNYGRDVDAGNYKPMVVNSLAEQIVALKANTNSAGSGTQYNLTCDTGGRLYVKADEGLLINAKTEAGAEQSLRCLEGALKVHKDLKEVREDVGASWIDSETTTAIDANEYSEMFFSWPTSQTSTTLNFYIQGSHTEGGTYTVFANAKNQAITNGNAGTNYIVKSVKEGSNETGWINIPYRWIQVKNDTGTAFTSTSDQNAVLRFR